MSTSNKIKIIYPIIIICLIITVGFVMSINPTPNESILGSWQEVDMEYRKKPHASHNEITTSGKKEILGEKLIYQAKRWDFLPNGEIVLHKDDGSIMNLMWTLKGRGHILKLVTENNQVEHYTLYRLNENEMSLHFHTDLQAKGIIQMKFKKVSTKDSYAQKI